MRKFLLFIPVLISLFASGQTETGLILDGGITRYGQFEQSRYKVPVTGIYKAGFFTDIQIKKHLLVMTGIDYYRINLNFHYLLIDVTGPTCYAETDYFNMMEIPVNIAFQDHFTHWKNMRMKVYTGFSFVYVMNEKAYCNYITGQPGFEFQTKENRTPLNRVLVNLNAGMEITKDLSAHYSITAGALTQNCQQLDMNCSYFPIRFFSAYLKFGYRFGK